MKDNPTPERTVADRIDAIRARFTAIRNATSLRQSHLLDEKEQKSVPAASDQAWENDFHNFDLFRAFENFDNWRDWDNFRDWDNSVAEA